MKNLDLCFCTVFQIVGCASKPFDADMMEAN